MTPLTKKQQEQLLAWFVGWGLAMCAGISLVWGLLAVGDVSDLAAGAFVVVGFWLAYFIEKKTRGSHDDKNEVS